MWQQLCPSSRHALHSALHLHGHTRSLLRRLPFYLPALPPAASSGHKKAFAAVNCHQYCVMDPDSVWNSLSDVERTSLLVALLRSNGCKYCWQSGPQQGQPLYSDPYGELWVKYCIPQKQQQMLMQQSNYDQLPDLAAVRTAELDNQIAVALAESSSIQQMVILGAGTDTRAWRLNWPHGFVVFEVDSQSVLDFKARVMAAAGQQQQQQQAPVLQCQKRVEVAADASKPQELWNSLTSAGFNSSRPTLYLLEGFIGYLTVDDSNALLAHLQQHSAPGSRIAVTAPPAPEDEARSAAKVAAAKPPPAVSAAVDGGGDDDGATEVEPMKLYHSTFEEPATTLERLCAAGWSDCQLLTKEHLTAKYGTAHAQPILIGRK